MNTIYYAIRRKSDGYYIPFLKGIAATHQDPRNPKKHPPRMWDTRKQAEQFLRLWLRGVNTIAYSFDPGQGEMNERTTIAQPGRKAADMEVVALRVTELPPQTPSKTAGEVRRTTRAARLAAIIEAHTLGVDNE